MSKLDYQRYEPINKVKQTKIQTPPTHTHPYKTHTQSHSHTHIPKRFTQPHIR